MRDELGHLKEENRRLRELLAQHRIALPAELIVPKHRQISPSTSNLSNDAKVRLFRELFRGREDVFAVRWESPDGRRATPPNRSATGKRITR